MDWIASDPGRPVYDWLKSWINREEPDREYREALIVTISSLWPDKVVPSHPSKDNSPSKDEAPETAPGPVEKPSYFPLPVLCARALGVYNKTSVAVNAAWVLLYMASYLLDKIEDQEIWHPMFSKLGFGPVANLTTGLILHAERILTELETDGSVDDAALRNIRSAFNRRALAVCAGQHMDLTGLRQSLDNVWETASGKSGRFFSLGSYLGARLASADTAQVGAFSQFGQHLGVLVQIANDIGGLFDETSDLALGKKTLPVVYALHVLPDDQRARLSGLLSAAAGDKSAEKDAKSTIISAGALVYLSLEADKHRQQAKNVLQQMGLAPERTSPLMGLLDHAIHTSEYYRKSGKAVV